MRGERGEEFFLLLSVDELGCESFSNSSSSEEEEDDDDEGTMMSC